MLSVIKQSRWLLFIVASLFVSQALGHGMSMAEKQSILEGGNLKFLWIGATHMLTGYDHLLFIFGIVFLLTGFKDIVMYITAFTLGNGVQVNYFLIDAVIALSVCYIAFANLDGFKKYLDFKAPNLLVMIIALGLIHGLGLSTRLQQLPLSEDHLLMNIIAFNVGIELGQILALATMLLLLTGWRKTRSFSKMSKVFNLGLIFAGVYLFMSVFVLCSALVAMPTLAGSGHEHSQSGGHDHGSAHGHAHGPVDKATVVKKANATLQRLVKAGKIDVSWDQMQPETVEKKIYAKGPEWVIVFKNSEVKEVSQQTLYMFYSLDGNYIAANYTGN